MTECEFRHETLSHSLRQGREHQFDHRPVFSTYYREMSTGKDGHIFHIFQNKADLSHEESKFFEGLTVDANRLSFVVPCRANII